MMGWWRTKTGTTIGDPPANYLDRLKEVGLTYPSVRDLPGEIRERIDAFYVDNLGIRPTDEDIRDLIAFCWGSETAVLGPLASQSPLPVAPLISEPRPAVLRQYVIDAVWVCECEILTADTARIDAIYRNDDAPRVREGELTYRLLESSDGKRTVEGIVIGPRASVGLTETDPRSRKYGVVNPRHIFDYERRPKPDESSGDRPGGGFP